MQCMSAEMPDENTLYDRPQHKEKNHTKIHNGFFHILFLMGLHIFIEIVCTASQVADAHGGRNTIAPEGTERLHLHAARQRNQHVGKVILRLWDPAYSK